jgi:hypothetical protein
MEEKDIGYCSLLLPVPISWENPKYGSPYIQIFKDRILHEHKIRVIRIKYNYIDIKKKRKMVCIKHM